MKNKKKLIFLNLVILMLLIGSIFASSFRIFQYEETEDETIINNIEMATMSHHISENILQSYYDNIMYVEKDGNNFVVKWRDQTGSTYELVSGGPGYPSHFVTGDWNGDGYDDYLLVFDQGSAQSNIFLYQHDGGYTYWTYQPRILFIEFGDWDGDGKDEIMYVQKTGSNSWEAKYRDQTGNTYLLLSGSGFPSHFASGGDWDGDGKDDYVIVFDQGTTQSNIFLYMANGGSTHWVYQPRILFIEFGLWNNPPNVPSNPSPSNNAVGVSITTSISWTGGDPDPGDTVTYDIYFGTSSNPPLVKSNHATTTYNPGTLNYNTKYYWKIVAKDNHGATTTGPIWCFTTTSQPNNPPYTPSNPSPANNAVGVSIYPSLSWTGGDPDPGDTVTYDIYFGTSSNPPLVKSNHAYTSYSPGTLNYNTKYYWKIVAKDNHGATTTGPIWCFTTTSQPNNPPYTPSNPSPENNAVGVSISPSLSWTGGDPDPGDTVTYDIYFGASSNPPLVKSNHATTTYNPGTLNYNTKYYWKIVAKDNHGATTTGPLWAFTTQDGNQPPPDSYTIVHITDTHIGAAGSSGRVGDVLNYINNLDPKPDMIIISGDLVEFGCFHLSPFFTIFGVYIPTTYLDLGKGAYADFKQLLSQNIENDVKIFTSPGNHDYRYGHTLKTMWFPYHLGFYLFPPWIRYHIGYSLQNYNSLIKNEINYGVEYKNSYIVSLDSGHDTYDFSWNSFRHLMDFIYKGIYPIEGLFGTGLTDSQINSLDTWLSSSNAQNKIVFMHHPVIGDTKTISNNKNEFINACETNNVKVVLGGHRHSSRIYASQYGTSINFEPAEDEEPLLCDRTFYVTTRDCGKDHQSYRLINIEANNVYIHRTENLNNLANLYVSGPAEIHAYNQNGDHVGVNNKGKPESQIHGATYGYLDSGEQFASVYYGENDYRFEIIGTDEGMVSMKLKIILKNGTTTEWNYENTSVTKDLVLTLYVNSDSVDQNLYIQNNNYLGKEEYSNLLSRMKRVQILKN
jgi:hypothetical protein